MLTWSKPNAIIPDQPLRWILTTLRFYAIVAGVGMVLAFAVISIQALVHHIAIPGAGHIIGDLVAFIAMCILFGAATYFTGRHFEGRGANMNTQAMVLAAIFCLVALALVAFATIGLPTLHGTPGSAYPPTINGQ